MGSQLERLPPWHDWDSCHVFSTRESSSISSGMSNTKTTTIQNSLSWLPILAFCKDRKVSENAVFKLAWCIVISAYAGLEDVCTAVRTSRGQTLLRCRLDPGQTAESLLLAMEEIDLATAENCTEVTDLALSSGLFQAILSIGGPDASPSVYSGTLRHPDSDVSTVAPLLEIEVDLSTTNITVHHPHDDSQSSRGIRAAELFLTCVNEIVAHADKRLCDLDILPIRDLQDIRHWNDKDLGEYNSCLHSIIHQRAEETPGSPAVCAWDGDMTYRELDIFSSHVAWHLNQLGVESGHNVAFLFHKSKWAIVSLLGILKAGAAAVALNSDYPVERSRYILEVTSVGVLLVGRDLEDMPDIPEKSFVRMAVDDVLFSNNNATQPAERDSFVSPTVQPSDVAYIQFTSGSTGKPKGVMIEHRAYLASAVSQHEACDVNKGSRVLQFANHSFDAILVEVLTPLLAGACVCIPSEDRRLNDLAGVMRDLRVNWMGITPTLARNISPNDVPDLRTLCSWGEAATPDIIDTWADAVNLINIYGPSENSAVTTAHSWSRGTRDPAHLGKGFRAVNTWIVRTENPEKLAPIGAIGELVLQGPTVARGYLHDDAGNGASFLTDTAWLPKESGVRRLYRTGDLVRYTGDGSLEFCGRRDTQVKIRGHRVELGEIEHCIGQSRIENPVLSVVDMIRPGYRPSQKTLVAFICEQLQTPPIGRLLQAVSDVHRVKSAALEEYLKKHLPPHFVPALYLPLRYLPTNPSGKADRRRLKAMAESLSELELMGYSFESHSASIRRPEKATEVLMARLWADVLGVDQQSIKVHDNFFWLGGNSILAMRLAVAARKQGLSVTVAQILNNPQLQQLSSIVATDQPNEEQPSVSSGYTPFSSLCNIFAQDFLRLVAAPRLGVAASEIEDIALATDYQIENLAWGSLQSRGGTNYLTFDFDGVSPAVAQLQTAIERLVSHHVILRTVYFAHQGRVYQAALKRLPMNTIHCLHVNDVTKTTTTVMRVDSHEPLDITQALIRFWILRNTEGEVKRLIFRASHLQYDGVTLIRWCKEIGKAMNSQDMLPVAPFFGYMHFAANHHEEIARRFWRGLLAGARMTNIFQHASIPWKHVLDGQVDTVVDTALVRSHPDITIGTTIKAAWALTLSEMAGVDDVVFGSVIWGRNATFAGVEDVAGPCIDNIPVRVRLKPGMTRLELLQQVQAQYFEAVDFESFQYKRIVRECTDWRPWERLSTLVEYENLGEESSRFKVNQSSGFTVDEIRPPADRHDVTIYSMPLGEQQTFIALDFCRAILTESSAQQMLDGLVRHIRAFHDDVHGPVEIAVSSEKGLPTIPLPLSEPHNECTKSAPCSKIETDDSGLDMRNLVEKAWISVLACQGTDLGTYWTGKKPFFEVWGNLIASYALARYFRDEGYNVTMEDILENVDMRSQAAFLGKCSLGVR